MTLETTFAVVLFVLVFLFGGRIRPLGALFDARAVVSFGAGMAAAYVFVHLMPELADAREVFAESSSLETRYEGIGIYFVALIAFLIFYALEHMRRRAETEDEARERGAFRFHVGAFAVYVFLIGYLLVHTLEGTPTSTALFGVALAFHFLSVDHEFRREYREAYTRAGKYVLAGAAMVGWLSGLLYEVSLPVLAMLVAFVSGAVIMNSAVTELPADKEGRFLPFAAGGILYGLVLVPLA